jgi:hypothetical protein
MNRLRSLAVPSLRVPFLRGSITTDDSFLDHRQHLFENQFIFAEAETPLLQSHTSSSLAIDNV